MSEGLAAGIYESLRSQELDQALSKVQGLEPSFAAVSAADAPDVLSRHVAGAVRRLLSNEKDPERRVKLVNGLLMLAHAGDQRIAGAIEQLVALTNTAAPMALQLTRPVTPLSDSALLTNSPGEPNLGAELRAEIASADHVDLLCAFIRWHGLRVLAEPLSGLRDRGVPFRVITTTYIGATERRAVDELVRRFGAQVRISYETQSTRLHAKAWLFRRNSGYDTAYVGSSNLSRAALLDGLEWNARLSGVATPGMLRKFAATFDSYWADDGFLLYDPDTDGDRLDDALLRGGTGQASSGISISGLDVRALPHQTEFLDALESERVVHGRHRNLVVAATGTGKTVVAALDYRRLCEQHGEDLSLLFVAHRREILEQSLRTYREVLADGAFGELYVGGARPERWRHVFASVQSLASYDVHLIPPSHFSVVVIDEFHRAEGVSYRRLLDDLKPLEMLGLTATPERSDGIDVRALFGDRTAYTLRLWDALAADLLVPFHYFGVSDDVDLSQVEWRRGEYDLVALDQVYTGHQARAAKILKELADKVTDPRRMRALGFCVSVAHARYMSEVFNGAGVPSLAVSGKSTQIERSTALARLRRAEVNCLFSADLFNEGLDLPEIDTILLLRPTQSATLFLQQLGRGLRRARGKSVLTVLDFIGQHRREFRFDLRYRALLGGTLKNLQIQVEEGFPFLPPGSQMVLDRVAQRVILENLRQYIRLTSKALIADIRSYGDVSLSQYLRDSGRELSDIYRARRSWTVLRRSAGLPTEPAAPGEEALLRRMTVLANVDDVERANTYAMLAAPDGPKYHELTERQQRLARMLFFALWPGRAGLKSYDAGFARLRSHSAVCAELRELVAFSLDATRHVPRPLGVGLGHVPLMSHAHYRREEVLAALEWASMSRSAQGNVTGVAWAEETQCDALFINLHKTERDFSPTTMYRDYAISPQLFHWESQNATSLESPAGRRYVNHKNMGSHVILFVRDRPEDQLGAMPFLCLGTATYAESRGEKPMAITWRLDREIPAETFRLAGVVAS